MNTVRRHKFYQSFVYAATGLVQLVRTQRNARIHLAATVAVVGFGLDKGLNSSQWLWIALAITLVWVAEAFNTAIECLGDRITLHDDKLIGRAKDVAAGGVLVAAIFAVVVASVVLF